MPAFATVPSVLAAGGITDINPGLTIWTGITFLVLLVVLGRFAWGPIVATLKERERTIREAIEEAKRERAQAEKLLAEQQEGLARAQRQAAELAHQNQQEVEALRQELTARARKEADELVADARRQIAEEVSRARADLKAQVVDLAIDAAGRLIQASLDEKGQRKLVEDYIAELPAERVS
ncbi:MAG TPA: F0F1 ATP synthase subunit B [Anaeromyxobacter sp.]|nr:F0F1 ATP synthase subunit B [Anaeromyxobacter sp.]